VNIAVHFIKAKSSNIHETLAFNDLSRHGDNPQIS